MFKGSLERCYASYETDKCQGSSYWSNSLLDWQRVLPKCPKISAMSARGTTATSCGRHGHKCRLQHNIPLNFPSFFKFLTPLAPKTLSLSRLDESHFGKEHKHIADKMLAVRMQRDRFLLLQQKILKKENPLKMLI